MPNIMGWTLTQSCKTWLHPGRLRTLVYEFAGQQPTSIPTEWMSGRTSAVSQWLSERPTQWTCDWMTVLLLKCEVKATLRWQLDGTILCSTHTRLYRRVSLTHPKHAPHHEAAFRVCPTRMFRGSRHVIFLEGMAMCPALCRTVLVTMEGKMSLPTSA